MERQEKREKGREKKISRRPISNKRWRSRHKRDETRRSKEKKERRGKQLICDKKR